MSEVEPHSSELQGDVELKPCARERHSVPAVRRLLHNILVCLDGSALGECGLPYAIAAAPQWDARITLLNVLEPIQDGPDRTPADALGWEVARAEARSYLESVRERVAAEGLEVEVSLVQGRAAEQILHVAREIGADLTVLSSHGERGHSEWNLSSTASKVIARAGGSVLVVPAHAGDEHEELQLRHILVPLDGSLRAESALPIVARLAREHSAEVILAHAVESPELTCASRATAADRDLVERLKQRNQRVATEYLQGVAARLGKQSIATHIVVLGEEEARYALSHATRERVDLTVLTAHGSTGSSHFPYGLVAEEFLLRGSSPLLVLQDLSRAELESCHHRDRKAPARSSSLYHEELK